MELKEVAVVSGKPGLFRIIKPAVNGVILEAMDGSGARFIVGTSTKVSVLGEISVYTEDGDNIPLIDVFRIIFAKHGKKVTLDAKQSDAGLRSFFTELVPEHDKQKVYISDIKKIVNWFNILASNGFEVSFANKEEIKAEENEVKASEPKKEKKAVKKDSESEEEIKEDTKKDSKPAVKKVLKEQEGSEKKAGTKPAAVAKETEKKAPKAPAKKADK